MNVNTGVAHTLVGQDAQWLAAAQRAHDTCEGQIGNRPVRTGPAMRPQPGARCLAHSASGARTHTLLAVAAGAALLGCSPLTSTPWRVDPLYRIESGNPAAAQGYLALALQYEGEGKYAQALEAYRNAAKAAPGDADMQNTLGLALAKHAQFAPAVAALRRAVALARESAQLLNNLGYALLLDGRAEDARAMLRLTLAVDPAHETALRNLAYLDKKLLPADSKAASQAAAAVATATVVPMKMAEASAAADAVVAGPVQAASNMSVPITATTVTGTQASPSAAGSSAGKTGVLVRGRLEGASIEIFNGNGVDGAAARLRQWLRDQGIEAGRLANLPPYKSAHTLVLYRTGKADLARVVADHIPVDADIEPAPAGTTQADLRVVIGHDARYSAGCASLATCATASHFVSSVTWKEYGPGDDGKVRP